MRVLVLAHSFIEKSGVENYTEDLFLNISKQYSDIEIVFLVNRTSLSYFSRMGVNIEYRPILNSQFGKIIYYLFFLWIEKFKLKPNLIFNVSLMNSIVFGWGTPVISVVHDLAEFVIKGKYSHLRMFYRKHLAFNLNSRLSEKIIAISDNTLNDAVRFGISKSKIVRIYSGSRYSISKSISSDSENKKFLFVGRMDDSKDPKTLLQAFEILCQKDFNVTLSFVGNSLKASPSFWEIYNNSMHKNKINILGYISEEELVKQLNGSFCMVYPTLYEGFGLPILEAFSHSLLVIAADNSCIREIGGDACLYFKTGDAEDLARLMEISLKHPTKAELIHKGYERVKFFSWDSAAVNYKVLFDKIT